MDLHARYGLRRVINACGKMTSLSAAIVRPEIIEVVAESLRHFFELDELQAAAGRVIARATGAESGCVTACTSAGITLGVAASMTGKDLARVHRLPDAEGMARRVLLQKGHAIDFGAPLAQQIRLAGAEVVEVGTWERCTAEEIRRELGKGGVAAVVAVESHHTAPSGGVRPAELVPLVHEFRVPVIVDAAAQDLRFRELVATGADLVVASAHKFLCATTAGVVAGRKELVEAVYLQNKGIGRGMKAGKEAIFGVIAALEYRMEEDLAAWRREQDRRVQLIVDFLDGVPGLRLSVDPDPNGCPFSRARLTPDPAVTGVTARSLSSALAQGKPTVVARAHHADEGYIHLDAIEMTDEEIWHACRKVRSILGIP
jgi:L-seryl-tRNA(Ser) seleniumtransferase